MASKRMLQVAEQIRGHIATMLVRGDIADPGARSVTISSVTMTADLQTAKVYFIAAENKKGTALKALRSAAGYIRRELGKVLHIRYTPEILFFYDDNTEHALHINSLLSKVKQE